MDLGRALPVFCLPFVHTVIECTPLERIYDPIPFFFNIVIGQPLGAPIFIFVMGACIHFSRNNDPKKLMKRGLLLFIAGFLLNILRFMIPYLIRYAVTGEADKFITPLPYRVFGNDILQFAGLFFILIGFLLYKRVSDLWILIIAAAMMVPGNLLRHADGQWELVVYRHSLAVAAMDGVSFREHEFELLPGDSVFVYTDGVPESTNSENELFGTDRMLVSLNREDDASPEKILKNVKEDLDTFVGEAPQFDDITMLCMKYNGPQA